MARPGLVRADTLDLQDQDNPSAAEHLRHPDGEVAPHQAAELHHVVEERHSEEQSLHEAWNLAGRLTDEPEAIERAQADHDHDHDRADGSHQDGVEGGEGSESEVEGDDDMMDRISSSPSIDDGGSTLPSSPPENAPTPHPQHKQITARRWKVWAPARSSSLSPPPTTTPMCEHFNSSSISPLSVSSFGDSEGSSPFVQTPQHLPLHERDKVKRSESSNSYLAGRDCNEYNKDRDGFSDRRVPAQNNFRPGDSHFSRRSFMSDFEDGSSYALEQSPSLTSIGSIGSANLDDVLLPVDDPLLDHPPPSPSSSSSSWDDTSEDSDQSCGQGRTAINDDADDDFFNNPNPRFTDSGWSGECLREAEDIDFEFVYALHTFVATVEGQANATKGDTMVLLDDSNSYWWLVRVVKDSSIGYLPAEHIETPTERLARLNKHRNIDVGVQGLLNPDPTDIAQLSATMLGDNSEKSRNPLKKAMRRRNAKTVQFAAPTYVEASDYDYSTEDEEAAAVDVNQSQDAAHVEDAQQQLNGESEPRESVDSRTSEDEEGRTSTPTKRASFDREQAATHNYTPSIDDPESSPKLVDKTEAAPLKSRKGTPRNADSFLKDDSIETKKITITPGLLREDNMSVKSASSESARGNSLENLVKTPSPTEQRTEPPNKKETKEKKKEKQKGGMLSGLFKKKDKKDKKAAKEDVVNGNESDMEKASNEFQRASPRGSPLQSGGNSPIDRAGAVQAGKQQQTPPDGNLQKPKQQPVKAASPVQEPAKEAENRAFVAELPGDEAAQEMAVEWNDHAQYQRQLQAQAQVEKEGGILSPIKNVLSPSSAEPKPKKAKRSKNRVELDDFDESPTEDDEEEGPNPFKEQEERQRANSKEEERLSESPVEVMPGTFMHGTEIVHIPTPGDGAEESSSEEDGPESLTSSPSIIEHPPEPHEESERRDAVDSEDDEETPKGSRSPDADTEIEKQQEPQRGLSVDSSVGDGASRLSPNSAATSWSDSSLRAWYDDGSEVKDMLTMIHDRANTVPVNHDHPMMVGLFAEERKGVQKMMGDLDGLLGSYLQRKGISLG
ncbi:hypothetical protein D0863_03793 [Hortaea werneckii]|uniref:SH3 domain-containing protein n=1 Tax=Hortaea werneckii TaxID=91943 RepID=A0A3M7EAV8_HORWE|nr:hypothetical protein D0863_03793 [Hortaea werneckii]